MSTIVPNKYFAFISYKSEDEKWAKWLQHKLEYYHLPSKIREKRQDLPAKIRPVFEFKSEMTGGYLEPAIEKALSESKWLIVICSPDTPQSPWVAKEVRYFINEGRADFIIPFVVAGEAFSKDFNLECFPVPLRELPKAHRGISINELGEDAAAVKVVAQMFGLGFNDLWQRFEREKRRKRNWIIAASFTAFLIMAGVAFWMYFQRQQILKANWKMMENQSRFVAEKANNIADEDSYLASRLAIEVLPEDLDDPDRPFTIEAEAALRNSFSPILDIIKGHDYNILSVAYCPDRSRIVSSSVDKTIRIWNVATGKELTVLKGHTDPVSSVAISLDGSIIVSSSFDKTVRVWDAEKGRELKSLVGHVNPINCVDISPDGKHVVTGSMDRDDTEMFNIVTFRTDTVTDDQTIRIWDVDSGQECNYLERYASSINSVAFSPDGKYIVSTSKDQTIRIWDFVTGRIVKTFYGYTGRFLQASFSPDGKRIVSASDDKTIRIWNVDSGEQLMTFDGHRDVVNSVCFSPDGKHIASASRDKTVRIWDIDSGEQLEVFDGHREDVNSVCFSPDGKHVVSASLDKTIRVWDADKDYEVVPHGHDCVINTVSFNNDCTRILSASDDGTVKIWDAVSGKLLQTIKEKGYDDCLATFSPDGKYVVSSAGGPVSVWESESGLLKSIWPNGNLVMSLAISPDGKQIATGSYETAIKRWDIESGRELKSMTGHSDYVISIAYSPDGKSLVSGSANREIMIWDTELGDTTKVLRGHTGWVHSVSFSHDGKRIVSASSDGTVRVWDVVTGKETLILDGHANSVQSAFWSPDDKCIVSASSDNTVRIWDVEEGVTLKIYKAHKGKCCSANFSPDGKRVVSASEDGSIRIWDFPPLQDLIDQTRERFKDRPLTLEERRQYYLE